MTNEQLLAFFEKHMKDSAKEVFGEGAGAMTAAVLAGMDKFMTERQPGPQSGPTFKGIGQQFVESPAYLEAVEGGKVVRDRTSPAPIAVPEYSLKPGERIPPMGSRWAKSWMSGEATMSQLITRDVTSSQFAPPRANLGFFPFPFRRLRLRDVMPVSGATAPVIDYTRIIGYSNNAAKVDEGAAKPSSNITTQLINEAAKTLATFIPITRQTLQDQPRARAWVENVLEYFITLVEDTKLLLGPGGTDFTGLFNLPDRVMVNFGTGNTIIDIVRKGITALNIAHTDSGFDPTAMVVHPTNWEAMELLKDTTGRYILIPDNATPADGIPRRLWQLLPVVTPVCPLNKVLLGDFSIGCELLTWESFTVRVTDSNRDWFETNTLALLGEQRAMFPVYFPKAFAEVRLT